MNADVADKDELTIKRASSAIRMLGAGFCQEMTSGKRLGKQKIYDQAALSAEPLEESELDQYAMIADNTEVDDQMVEALVQQGDEDATLVMDFEAAATELLQNDDNLSAAYTAYTDAHRHLNEKVRSGLLADFLKRKIQRFSQRSERQVLQGAWIVQKVFAATDSGVKVQTLQPGRTLEGGVPEPP